MSRRRTDFTVPKPPSEMEGDRDSGGRSLRNFNIRNCCFLRILPQSPSAPAPSRREPNAPPNVRKCRSNGRFVNRPYGKMSRCRTFRKPSQSASLTALPKGEPLEDRKIHHTKAPCKYCHPERRGRKPPQSKDLDARRLSANGGLPQFIVSASCVRYRSRSSRSAGCDARVGSAFRISRASAVAS